MTPRHWALSEVKVARCPWRIVFLLLKMVARCLETNHSPGVTSQKSRKPRLHRCGSLTRYFSCSVSGNLYLLSYANSLIPFRPKRALLQRFNVAGINKTYLKAAHIFAAFQPNLDLLASLSRKCPVSIFKEIRQVRAALIHAEIWTWQAHFARLCERS